MSRNSDASPGWTERIVPLGRKMFGDDMTIYIDANGSYDVPTAIEVGRMLEEYNVAFYEEPVEWLETSVSFNPEIRSTLPRTITKPPSDRLPCR